MIELVSNVKLEAKQNKTQLRKIEIYLSSRYFIEIRSDFLEDFSDFGQKYCSKVVGSDLRNCFVNL